MDKLLCDRADIDGSCVRQVSVATLINYPIWNGNRFLDEARVETIKGGITSANDLHFVYHAIEYDGDDGFHQIEIIDGQHRIAVLKSIPLILSELAPVILIVKRVTSEEEAVSYFNKINDIKPQKCDDKKLLTNSYVAELSKKFPSMIRMRTHRPYLDSVKLKEAILSCNLASTGLTPARFVELAVEQNEKLLLKLRDKLEKNPNSKSNEKLVRYINNKFALSFPVNLEWLRSIKLAA